MKRHAPRAQAEHVMEKITQSGLQPIPLHGTERTVIAVIGDERSFNIQKVRAMPGVSDVMAVLKPYKLAARETKHDDTIINIKGIKIGGKELIVMAGPCSVESEKQINETAKAVKKAGAKILRGGAYKPRTDPYSFEGLGVEGLKMLKDAADENKMIVVTEAMDFASLDNVVKYADIVQIGARNMQNFNLLREVGKSKLPVLLKRGMSATIREWLLAAEYILSTGNPNVILCERGIRTFEDEVRNTFAVNSIPVVKHLSHLPVIADPSHAAGKRMYVSPLAKAGIAAGADGIIVEVHPNPEEALSDGDQSLLPEDFAKMMKELKLIAQAVGRTL